MASRQAWVTLRHHIELRRAVASCDRVADVARNVEGERVPFSHAEGTDGKLRGDGDEVAAVGRDCANHAPGRGGSPRAGESSGHEERSFHQRSFMRSEEHTSELQSLMRISYAVFCLKKKKNTQIKKMKEEKKTTI